MGTRNHILLKHNSGTYYFTTTVVDWKHIFIKRSVIFTLINSILFFQNERQVRTNGYCIMPNHLHWIFTLPGNDDDIILLYIHNNPIQPHWALVEQRGAYPFSSFRYYHTGQDWNGINILSLL